MKIKVEYSESIQIAEGLWRKIGIEIDDEIQPFSSEHNPEGLSQLLHNQAKEYVQRWHKEAQHDHLFYKEPIAAVTMEVANNRIFMGQKPHNSVIEDTPVDLEKEIMSCSSLKVLESYKFIVRGKEELQKIYDEKFAELSK